MSTTSSGSTSVWMNAAVPRFSPLNGNLATDICVIGGGIAGLTTAYLLAKQGKAVTLIEAMEIGAGETGRTTAHFFPPDDRYVEIERGFGSDIAALVADSFQAATDLVESIIHKEAIDCEFERLDGYLFSLDSSKRKDLDKELAAAKRAGVDVEPCTRVPDLSFDTGPCLRFPRQAQFHPMKYLNGLALAVVRHGGRIFTGTRAFDIQGDKHKQLVTTSGGQIRAKAVLVATNTPFNNRVVMHTKLVGYRTYVLGLRVPKASIPKLLLWDTGHPYYYVRLMDPAADSAHQILVVGGADHRVGLDGHPEHRYDEIEAWVRERFPMAQSVDFKWSGEVMEPVDGLAYMGRNPLDDKNVYIITGDSGNGMTHCTAGAILISDLIMGRANAWTHLYDPARKPISRVSNFIKQQAKTLSQYGDWLTGGEIESAREIPPGQGAILREGQKKLAVYRDEEGELHAFSAACTHLGCVVAWNSAERSWDCPCHASRFDAHGQVLHGPASQSLEPANLQTSKSLPDVNTHIKSPTQPRH
jgi:glycine/D-amino acid oxidase-like deaminating enzyme/nitrite reductase/ring-hydroxylating ferredoxin subunit